jgi:hypothetical protein
MDKTSEEVQNAYGQVTLAIKSLDRLMSAQVGDLRIMYKDFQSEMKALETAAEDARNRAISMQTKSRDYLTKWAQEVENIENPQTKEQSLQRFNKAKAGYLKIEQLLFKCGAAYAPMLKSLKEVQTVLDQDLTKTGIATAKPSYTTGRQQAIDLQSALKEANAALGAGSENLSPAASGMVQ